MDFTLNNLTKTSLNWLFPKKCIRCQGVNKQTHHPCCERCYEQLPFQPPCCHHCGQAFAADSDICGRCIAKPPPFDACFCPFQYKEPVNTQIQQFKYHERPELAGSIAQLMVAEIQANQLELPDLLIPVPLHISRLRERGFNQSLLLAKSIGKLLEIPVATDLICKHRETAQQAQLTFKQRNRNLSNSFKLLKSVPEQSVAIIDDVVTTGNTAAEIAKILKRNGVDCVQVWGIAHTV